MATLHILYRIIDANEREVLKLKVMSYENNGLIKKYCYENNVSEQEALIAFTELKKFLFVCGVTNERLSPSAKLDDIWHQFILFTKDYIEFCKSHFGRVVHHFPDVEFNIETKNANKNSYTRAYDIAELEFTTLNSAYWINPNFLNAAKCSGDDVGTTGCNSKCAG